MKLFAKKHTPDYAEIARLERELGMDDASVTAELESRKQARMNRGRPVLLDRPMARLHQGLANMQLVTGINPYVSTADVEFAPGARWSVDEADSVRVVCSSATVLPRTITTKKSLVVLPDGVSA